MEVNLNLQTILKRFDFTAVRRRVERGRYYWDMNKVLKIGAGPDLSFQNFALALASRQHCKLELQSPPLHRRNKISF